ncbi:AAA family ATPase [Nostoc sp. FACHB-87]|uniref:AAA family ATPase n=1 Tax=Nostocales TaxID=1161 RepID=UPI001686E562|nr:MULTISPECIES: AAA family ATPase [Nostocales]MBD2452936.1 AAA family ATPase [Nostoc sp. FACHB-87]MBD2474882.1 AAA family ATPase [Anabaena sp. FACHB-83]MBD2488224.1 AAA family ATPase [Aulosira sp. FACHB-615]
MNHVFDHLQINRYRGLKTIALSQLGQVNIFVGDNNSGKTSILEAIAILCNPLDPFQWLEISQRRVYLGKALAIPRPDIDALKWIFPQNINSFNQEESNSEILINTSGNTSIIGLKATLEEIYGSGSENPHNEQLNEDVSTAETDSVRSGLELKVIAYSKTGQRDLFTQEVERQEIFQIWENERFIWRKRSKPFVNNATVSPSYSSSQPILERLTQIILEDPGGKQEVLEIIQWFDKNIIDIQILSPSTAKATLYIEHQQLGFAPLYTFGDGLKRTLVIALTLFSTKNGVLLIDEIETSIHVSALSRVFSWLVEACCKRNVQLFTTTHSLEAVDAMLQTDMSTENIVAFRLNPQGKPPQRFSGNLLHRLRSERGLDIRGSHG